MSQVDRAQAQKEASYIAQLREQLEETPEKTTIQQIAYSLLPQPLQKFHYRVTEDALWRYISRQKLDGSSPIEVAAIRLALLYFPPEEVLMAAGNAGSKTLALIAGYVLEQHYSSYKGPKDDITQIVQQANLSTATNLADMLD